MAKNDTERGAAASSAQDKVASVAGKGKDAIALIKEDHRRVEALFKQYEGARDSDAKQQVVDQIATELIAAGKPASSPAAVVCQATLPTQRSVVGRLDDIAVRVRETGLHAPSLIIVGEVLDARQPADWFTNRPLSGVSIGLARAEEQLEPVIARVLAHGGEPVLMPLIRIAPPDSWTEVDATIRRLADPQRTRRA